ncbi:MAG: CotH kinase family protein, partial [Bacteroidales bacterium]|nr:CotH kinase family protein [Bacteroidales bacterium]
MKNMKFMSKAVLCAGLSFITQNAVSQVFINEISTNTDTIEVFGQKCDWIELYNPSSGYVYMHNFAISDNPDNPKKWVFPDSYKIEPYGFLMVLCNGEATGANTNFKLSAKGETIVLSNNNGNIIDQVIVPPLLQDQTYGRAQDGSHIWGVFKEATPYASNNSSEAFTTPPTVDIEGGFYNENQSVTVSCTDPDAEILYSTNGCEPFSHASSNPANFTINKNTVLRVCALNPELKRSQSITNTYFINHRECDLPVVALSTDPQNFYHSTRGIYVQGSAGIKGNCVEFPANWNQDWERPVHFEYFDKNHKKQVSVDAGVKIFGACSRANAMKSLRIVARQKEYGPKRIEYKIFENKDIDKFKSIVLRNGGNDFDYTMLRDGIITQLCAQHMDVDVQAFQPASVYLNGEYLGLHNIREKISEHYIDENYGLEDEDIDLLENNAQIIEGSDREYKELIYYVGTNSLKDDKNFKYISDHIDVNNYTDYIIAQLFIDNEDWPNNNIKYWKTNGKNSKWRWILFGTEYSLGLYGRGASDNSIKRVLVDKDNALGNS